MTTPPPALGHYRQSVRAPGATTHIAGQVSVDSSGKTICVDDPAGQARQIMANLTAVLDEAGHTPSDVVAVRVYATNRDAAAAWAHERLTVFETNPPASTLVFVAGLASPEWLLEVEAVASV